MTLIERLTVVGAGWTARVAILRGPSRRKSVTGDQTALRVARERLAFLESVCFAEGHLTLIGNAGWYPCGGKRSSQEISEPAGAGLVSSGPQGRSIGDRFL